MSSQRIGVLIGRESHWPLKRTFKIIQINSKSLSSDLTSPPQKFVKLLSKFLHVLNDVMF